jgi:uncharacterized protein YraI
MLYVGLDASFDNMEGWEEIRDKAVEENNTAGYITDRGVSC